MVVAALRWPFSFSGRVGRLTYLVASLVAFLSQHLLVIGAYDTPRWTPPLGTQFWVLPLRALAKLSPEVLSWPIGAIAFGVLVTWILAALALRRATDAGAGAGLAALVIVPIVQLVVIPLLASLPPRAAPALDDRPFAAPSIGGVAALQGLVIGAALSVAVSALSMLVFRTYADTLFIVTPFLVGVVTATVANRHTVKSWGWNAGVVAGAIGLGGLVLVGLALEGIVCILMAAPLAYVMALIGAAFGLAIARRRARAARQLMSVLALVPLALVLDEAFPPGVRFEAVQSVTVAAPPAAVWRALVEMGTIDAEPGLLFRLGVAYPLGGELIGQGVGAERYGAFSTGIAHEMVSEWEPEHKITLTILRDVPSMRELSPYEHVAAPHVDGWFRTESARFTLTPRTDGTTVLTERTVHALKLEPVLYWLPMARWVVAQNGARALDHLRRKAERFHAEGGS